MCIPSQIIGDSDPKTLYTLDIFEDRSLESIMTHGSFLSVSLLFASDCKSDGLKSHTPFLCPTSQSIYIFLTFSICSPNPYFSVTNTVIAKNRLSKSMSVETTVIYRERKQRGTKDSRQYLSPIRFCSVYKNLLLPIAQKRISSHL